MFIKAHCNLTPRWQLANISRRCNYFAYSLLSQYGVWMLVCMYVQNFQRFCLPVCVCNSAPIYLFLSVGVWDGICARYYIRFHDPDRQLAPTHFSCSTFLSVVQALSVNISSFLSFFIIVSTTSLVSFSCYFLFYKDTKSYRVFSSPISRMCLDPTFILRAFKS